MSSITDSQSKGELNGTSPGTRPKIEYIDVPGPIKLKNFDVALDLVKQQITLASVLLGFAIAFTRRGDITEFVWIFKTSIFLMMCSFIAGVFAISLMSKCLREECLSAKTFMPSKVVKVALLQGILFVSSVIFITFFMLSYV